MLKAETLILIMRDTLSKLNDIATSPASMGVEDVDDLCSARELLADALGYVYNGHTCRYEPLEDTSDAQV